MRSFRKPSNMANGNTYDRRGRMLTCEHATSRVTRTDANGAISVLATHFDGKELNSPNDIVVKSDGRIYFTDPTFGRVPFYGVERKPELSFRGVYRMDEDGGDLSSSPTISPSRTACASRAMSGSSSSTIPGADTFASSR